jgi:hypothetical protein
MPLQRNPAIGSNALEIGGLEESVHREPVEVLIYIYIFILLRVVSSLGRNIDNFL